MTIDFFIYDIKAQTTKAKLDKQDYIKLNIFCIKGHNQQSKMVIDNK